MSGQQSAVRLVKNDGSETFVLKATAVERQLEQGLLTRTLISVLSGILGANIVLNSETYQVRALIEEMDASMYPNASSYGDDDLGYERELNRAAKEWGPDLFRNTSSGFQLGAGLDRLEWDTRNIDGVLTSYSASEDRGSDKARDYQVTLEFTHIDARI